MVFAWLVFCTASLYAQSADLDERLAVADEYKVLGNDFYRLLQYDSALVNYYKALEAVERMRDFAQKNAPQNMGNIDTELASSYMNIGNVYNMQGMYHEAIDYYQRVLLISDKYDWKDNQIAVSYNIGEIYRGMENHEQTKAYFTKMDSLSYLTNDSVFIAYSKYAWGMYYRMTKDYAKALQNAEVTYAYFSSRPELSNWTALTLRLLSSIYLEGFDDDMRAEEYAQQALQIYDELGLANHNKIFHTLSQIYLKRGQWRKAEQTALQALAIDDSEPYNTLAQHKVLAKAYAYLNEPAKADEYIDKILELQASWSNQNYQYAIREMEVRYETEKKEALIVAFEEEKRLMTRLTVAIGAVLLLGLATLFFLWRWTVQKRRLAEKQKKLAEQQHQLAEQQVKQLEQEKQLVATQAVLDGEVQERTRLARDLHDGLGSILAAAKYNLADVKKDAPTESAYLERYEKAMSLLDDSIHEMRRIAHHLMPESLSSHGLKRSIADFCNSVPHVKFNYYGDETRLDPKMEVMVYRIMHELVSNALKHASASHILVQIVQDTDCIDLTVQDDGCGFDPSAVSEGMGLANIRTRVAAYNGNLMMDSQPGVGTEVSVELTIYPLQ